MPTAKLLTRQQLILLNEKASLLSTKPPLFINEKAVDWNHSILGRTSKGIGGLFSMLAGKIKEGFQKEKLRSLVIAWGTEYVIALEASKKGVQLDTKGDGLNTDEVIAKATKGEVQADETPVEPGAQGGGDESEAAFAENAKEFGPKIEQGKTSVGNIVNAYGNVQKWLTVNNQAGFKTLKDTVTKDAQFLTNADNTQAAEDFIFDNDKLAQYNDAIKSSGELLKIISDPASTPTELDKFLGSKGNSKAFKEAFKKQAESLQSLAGFYDIADQNFKLYSAIAQEMDALKKLKDAKDDAGYNKAVADAKVKLEKQFKSGQEVIASSKDSKSPAIKKIKGFVDALTAAPATTAAQKPAQEEKPGTQQQPTTGAKPEEQKPATEPATPPAAPEKPAQKESLSIVVNEADAPVASKTNTPTYIANVFPVENLEEFKKIKNNKETSVKNININKLDIINYQAEDIITNAKNATAKKGKEEAPDALKKEWDLGLKYLNELFKDVVDTNKIMTSLGKKAVGEDIKKQVKDQDVKFKMMEDMSFDEKLPVKGGHFTNKGLYVFECDLKYMKDKGQIALEGIFLALSPTAQFVEDLNGVQYFWHKCLGQYKYDEEKKTIGRVNFLQSLTNRRKPIEKNANEDDYVYFAFTNQSVMAKFNPVFFYTKVGFFPLGRDLIKTVGSVQDALKQYDAKKWLQDGNEIGIRISSRYTVAKEDITKYPGIDEAGLASDKGFDVAKANHDLLMPIVTEIETPKKK